MDKNYDDIWAQLHQLAKVISDNKYDLTRELREAMQGFREDLYDIRLRIARIEAEVGMSD